MLDVDGTIVGNNNFEALPSPRVREAIKKAKEILHVGIVTSRPLFLQKKYLQHWNFQVHVLYKEVLK